MEWLVFSKDRPFQLDAFIKTATTNAGIEPREITVLYRYEGSYAPSIEQVKKENEGVKFVKETSFKNDVIQITEGFSSDEISFATDDAVFTRNVNRDIVKNVLMLENVLCFSSRLGFNINYCYPLARSQRIPDGQIMLGTFFFPWENNEGDWSYPFSVDGHFFNRNLMVDILKRVSFNSPNTLESSMSTMRYQLSNKPLVATDIFSSYFNIPLNVVQDQFKNRHGTVSAQELLKKYENGERFDPQKIRNFLNQSPHQEVSL